MTEPGEDTCLRCHHPDHFGGTCGALMGTFYGDDGAAEDDLCDCMTYRLRDVAPAQDGDILDELWWSA